MSMGSVIGTSKSPKENRRNLTAWLVHEIETGTSVEELEKYQNISSSIICSLFDDMADAEERTHNAAELLVGLLFIALLRLSEETHREPGQFGYIETLKVKRGETH